MDTSLNSLFMMQLPVKEVYFYPKFMPNTPTLQNQLVYFKDISIRFPLILDGIISYLPS